MKSKGATKNFKGGLIRKPKLAKRGFWWQNRYHKYQRYH
jgi:hypothetical protein